MNKPLTFKETAMRLTLSKDGLVYMDMNIWELIAHSFHIIPVTAGMRKVYDDPQILNGALLVSKVTFAGAEFVFEITNPTSQSETGKKR